MMITGPGVYDVPEVEYHSGRNTSPRLGRSLSYSGAKVLLDSPARFAATGTALISDAADFGSTVHALALRSPDKRIRVYDAYDWRLKAHQTARKADREDGLVPINRAMLRTASRVAAAIRRHPLASALLSEGVPEQSIYWQDASTGVLCRARIDWVRSDMLVDLKTCAGGMARVGAFGRRAAALDYPMQAAHYRAGWREVTGQDLPMAFIIAETEPPHLVIVGFLPHWAEEVGRARMDAALADFARRESEDDWPTSDYPETFVEFDVPPYYERTIP